MDTFTFSTEPLPPLVDDRPTQVAWKPNLDEVSEVTGATAEIPAFVAALLAYAQAQIDDAS